MSTGDLKNSGPLFRTSGLLKGKKSRKRASTGKLINAHYIEMEYLLDRVENSTTHYQVLGVDRTATNEKIILAYHKSVAVLHHPYYKVRAAVPDDILERIDSSFKKISEAFSVLTHSGLRNEYDRSLLRKVIVPIPVDESAPAREILKQEHSPVGAQQQPTYESAQMAAGHVSTSEKPVFWKAADKSPEANRRRCERFKLTVPTLVAGYDRAGGKWQEVARTIDVGRLGVAIRLKKRVRHGSVVHVTLPLPTKLRSHGFSEPGYNMYAIVRRVEPVKDGMRVVGLEFLGKRPPTGYLYQPWAMFRTDNWNGNERRRESRYDLAEQVVIEYFDESMRAISREATITENISRSGARVIVRRAPAEFEMVKVVSAKHRFQGFASVRNQYVGKDNLERLCLQFAETKWPIES